jgi:hypothetical protein
MSAVAIRWTCALLLVAALSGCTELRLISDYDEFTETTVTSLQRQVETLLTTLERRQSPPACSYAQFETAYLAMDVDLNLLLARNKPRPRNRITSEQLELLGDSLDTMEELHRQTGPDACLGAADIMLLRAGFESSFTAIILLETAKRRGVEPEK